MSKEQAKALSNALAKVQKIITSEVVKAIKINDFTNARKYTTTCRHLDIARDLVGKNA